MSIFASDLVEGLGLLLPDPAKPVLSLEPYIEDAWSGAGMGTYVGPFMDVARSFGELVESPIAFAGKILDVTDLIPSEVIPFASSLLSLGMKVWEAEAQENVRESLFGLALGTAVTAGLGMDPVPPWQNEVKVRRFIDCSKPFNARTRTVLPPQKMPAPWRDIERSYPQPSGNCRKGYAVWCDFSQYPHGRKKPGAGGSRCSGKVDVSVLLYPYWTGARPPGPAPVFVPNKGEQIMLGLDTLDTNADMVAAQSYYLGTCIGNFRVSIAEVVKMRNNLRSLVGQYEEMQVAPPEQNYILTDRRLEVAAAMCDAFIAARAAFVRTDEALALSVSPMASKLDPDARAETLAWHNQKIDPPNVPEYVPGIAVGPQTPPHQRYQASDGEGPFVGYTPDMSAHIEAQNPPSSGAGAFMLLGAAGLTYFLAQGAK